MTRWRENQSKGVSGLQYQRHIKEPAGSSARDSEDFRTKFQYHWSYLFAADGETVDSLRRYEIATVRRRGGGRGPPAAHLAADLDFVSPRAVTPAEAALSEAEAILVRNRNMGYKRRNKQLVGFVLVLQPILEMLWQC